MELLAIGTLVAYTKVTISVLVSRFQHGVQSVLENEQKKTNWTHCLQNILSKWNGKPSNQSRIKYRPIIDEDDSSNHPLPEVTERTASRAELAVFLLVVCLVALAVTLIYLFDDISKGKWWAIFLMILFSGTIVVSLFIIQLQPRNSATFPFMVPCVPYIPALTIFINAVLMANLQWKTYMRFGVWMTLGEGFLFRFNRLLWRGGGGGGGVNSMGGRNQERAAHRPKTSTAHPREFYVNKY